MCHSRGGCDDGAVNAVRLRSGAGSEAAAQLDRNDAYNIFKPLGDLVMPGPTFTNGASSPGRCSPIRSAPSCACSAMPRPGAMPSSSAAAARNAATSASSSGRSRWRPRCCRRGGARSPAPAAADLELSTAAAGAGPVAGRRQSGSPPPPKRCTSRCTPAGVASAARKRVYCERKFST